MKISTKRFNVKIFKKAIFVIINFYSVSSYSQIPQWMHDAYEVVFKSHSYNSNCKLYGTILDKDLNCLSSGPWVLVFNDEFNGSHVDTNKWHVVTGVNNDPSFSASKQWYKEDNLIFNNGNLEIWAKEENLVNQDFSVWETDHMEPYVSDFKFTSGEIWSKYKFGYGYYEVSCRLPKGKGYFPAFWTFTSPWNEIDIFEFWNETNNENQRIINTNGHVHWDSDNSHYKCGEKYDTKKDLWVDFHKYGMYYTPDKIEWYFDDIPIRTEYKYQLLTGQDIGCSANLLAGSQLLNKRFIPHDIAMEVILNLALQSGSNQPGNINVQKANFEIEYFRFHQKMDCSPLSIYSTWELPTENGIGAYNFIAAESIQTVSPIPVIVFSGKQLEMVANDFILFNPGFEVKSGTDFIARIDEVCPREEERPNFDLSFINSTDKMNVDRDNIRCENLVPTIYENKSIIFENLSNDVTVRILDIFGQEHSVNNYRNNELLIYNIQNLKKGIYFINAAEVNENCEKLTKFIVY